MSFCGHVAASPAAPVAVDRMLRAVAIGAARTQRHWTGDGARIAVADGATLATGPGERVALVDGMIHNRAELRAALGLAAGEAAGDAALALAAHARWGDDCVEHIVGDFALAVWDGARRRMVMAVEPGGSRSLMFACVGGDLRIANEPRGLLADPAVGRALDQDRVAHWLALVPPPAGRTFFRDISRVPSGGRAIWHDGRVAIDRWWRPERLPMLRLADHRDYAAAVRASLDQAVACRLGEAHDRVGSHLSGGLDSGAVTAIAAQHLAAGGRRLDAFTAVPSGGFAEVAGSFGNEWAHAAAVAARYPNIDHHAADNAAAPLMDVVERREHAQDVPLFNLSNMVWVDAIDARARDRGVTIMLQGAMGNMTFSYDGFLLTAQLLYGGRWGAALASALAMRRRLGWPARRVATHLIANALPMAWRRRVLRAIGRPPLATRDFSAIHPAFLRASGLADHAMARTGEVRSLHPRDGRALRIAVMGRNDIQGDFASGTRRLYGIDTRDPTHDRRLAELCLSIPEEQFRQDGMPRSLARSALADDLPSAVLGETRTGLQAADWAHGFGAAVPGMRAEIERQRASRMLPGWIDLDRLADELDAWPDRVPATGDAMAAVALTRAMTTGRFVRRVEGGNA